ncbi:hypothetical protein GmHk_19G055341 [Glycine max]|nr:hypothetical protein GmHk_19G055341 [Glycine max]
MAAIPTPAIATHTICRTTPFLAILSTPPTTTTTKRSFHGCQTTFHYHPQHPPNHLEFSPATEDRLEAVLVKLVVAQRRLNSTLDALLLKLPLRTNHHYPPSSVQSPPPPMPIPPPSSSSTQTFLTHTPIPPL